MSLEALRDRLAADIEDVDPRYRAPLAKQLSDVLDRLAAIPAPKEVSSVDDLLARRAARGAAAAGQ